MTYKTILSTEILPFVDKPSRYLGNELNAVKVTRGEPKPDHKNLDTIEVRIALTFPDLYDIGLSNLGLHILGDIVNSIPWAVAERCYAPGVDLEAELRKRSMPLFALESREPISTFDMIGFTLQSELTYTNILNILDMSGIPLRAENRREGDPLICGGGPTSFNPEPIAPFFDFFVIGDGEDVLFEIIQLLRATKELSRAEKVLRISELKGVYVPALVTMEMSEEGWLVAEEGTQPIQKRTVADLNASPFPEKYIVPYTQQIHDRVSLEVLRGCTQGCRFCQAGMVTRPVRERTTDKIVELMDSALNNTGYEEVSLVSLSTCDHSDVKGMVQAAAARAREDRVGVSLPSLRLDSFSVELSDIIAQERRSGITFAPEAATPRVRAVINKWIPDEDLLEMSRATYERGWELVKLYFMIGLPTERDEDVDAIADLAIRTLDVGLSVKPSAKVNLGVSTFVPRPFTSFQWCKQIDIGTTNRLQRRLSERFRGFPKIKFGRHPPHESYLEGLMSRTDRRTADLIEAAFKLGCRFDGWREHLRFDFWLQAIEEVGFDTEAALGERDPAARLPWDHIDINVDKEWLVEDYRQALDLQHAPDCRAGKCHKCGVIDKERELCATMLRDHINARKTPDRPKPPPPTPHEVVPVQRLWMRIGRVGDARLLTHLETMNVWLRALRRAGTRMAYSQGFHPHPRVAFAGAAPMGHETLGDYMDIKLLRREEPADLIERINHSLPPGFSAIEAWEVDLKAPSLMSIAAGGEFMLTFNSDDTGDLARTVSEINAADELIVQRRKKKKKKKGRFRPKGPSTTPLDVRPMIESLEVVDKNSVRLRIIKRGEKTAKVREVLSFFVDDAARVNVRRLDTYRHAEEHFRSIGTEPRC